MPQIRIPPLCMFCQIPPDRQADFKYPHHEERVLTRVAWHGMDPKGKHVMTWEDQAGSIPNRHEFPALTMVPMKAWCPNCLVEYHVGPLHPNDDARDDTPRIIV